MKEIELFRNVLNLEANAILAATKRINDHHIESLKQLYETLINTGGSLVFCGVGKSGIVAQKLASTFSSLGLSSYFLHPVEALHGDLGRLTSADGLVLISKSGTTEEIIKLMPFVNIPTHMIVGLLGSSSDSPIASKCGVVLDCSVEKEACINNLAPTTSTTVAMAMGDAMAVLFEKITNLSKEKFAANHPGGLLGKALRLKVHDLMIKKDQCPILTTAATLKDVILKMTELNVGLLAICEKDATLLGIIVEGDIRRSFTKNNRGLETSVTEIMNKTPVKTTVDMLALDALKLMEKRKNSISVLPVVSSDNKFLGVLRLHDLLKEGLLVN